jgi:predicted acylesterase/phospholipase RssA
MGVVGWTVGASSGEVVAAGYAEGHWERYAASLDVLTMRWKWWARTTRLGRARCCKEYGPSWKRKMRDLETMSALDDNTAVLKYSGSRQKDISFEMWAVQLIWYTSR